MKGYLLGLDLGTSSLRALLLDETGVVAGTAGCEYPIDTPRPGWAEQDPEAWWRAACHAVRTVLTKTNVDRRHLLGIGLAGQMHGTVLVDRHGSPLRPAIIWTDQRSKAECDLLGLRLGPKLHAITGLPAATGFTCPSLLWLIKHEPEVWSAAAKVLTPKDFLRARLTGAVSMDVTDGSGTALMSVQTRNWSDEILAALDLSRELLPVLHEAAEPAGRLQHEAASALGLPAGIPIIHGGGDQAMGALANRAVRPGAAVSTIATGGQFLVCVDQPIVDPGGRLHTLCHCVKDRWLVMGAHLAAGLSLRWFRDTFGAADTAGDPYALLGAEAAQAPVGAEGLIFLPYLAGERTPHLDPEASGCYIGLTLRHGRPHLIRALMEGVAYALNESLSIITALGIDVHQITASGGGARSTLWRQIQADVFGRDLTILDAEEHSALGAAILAGSSLGILGGVEDASARVVHDVDRTLSRPGPTAVYHELQSVYRTLYPSLKHAMGGLHRIGRTAQARTGASPLPMIAPPPPAEKKAAE